VELRGLISYSAAASLAASLLLRPLWSQLARRTAQSGWRRSSTLRELAYIGGHLLAGALLAMLFWLSWGLAALVSVPWWQRGVVFGLVSGLTLMLPLVVILVALRRESPYLYVVLLTEALITAIACGEVCSFYWANAVW